jgi:solute carrier family 31 (copper transporter), member 1
MIDISGFISRTWHITSGGMFAGSCIGVILLVCSLELLRRLGKEYDRYLVRQFERQASQRSPSEMSDEPSDRAAAGPGGAKGFTASASRRTTHKRTFKPNVLQQFTRALLHMLQFGVAYFIMLLAMYYNGYIIICILIGALLGSLVFNWETLGGVYG